MKYKLIFDKSSKFFLRCPGVITQVYLIMSTANITHDYKCIDDMILTGSIQKDPDNPSELQTPAKSKFVPFTSLIARRSMPPSTPNLKYER